MLDCPKLGSPGVHAVAARTNTIVEPSGDQSGNMAVPVVGRSMTGAPVTPSRIDSLPSYAVTSLVPSGLNDDVAAVVFAAACCIAGLVASTEPSDMVMPLPAPARFKKVNATRVPSRLSAWQPTH